MNRDSRFYDCSTCKLDTPKERTSEGGIVYTEHYCNRLMAPRGESGAPILQGECDHWEARDP